MTPVNDSLTLFGIFLLGLGLNLTPCVYPMMTVTISLFGSQKDATRFHAFVKSVAYVVGIAVTYSTLGVITAFTGGFFGALLQSKWVLFAIAIILAGLALSMFNVYTLTLPSGIVNKLAGKRSVTIFGFFFSGVFVGVFAAPCIGPTILALITFVASKGDPVYAFWIFFTMSMGLGLPYLLLGTFSGLMKKLPRSGVWLIWIERLFGVVLMSLAAFYLILAVKPALLPWLVPGALIAGGGYLGFFENSAKYGAKFSLFKKFAGTVAVATAVLMTVMAPRQSVLWEPYSDQKVAEAQKAGRPVLLDFYADWCIPCHELDNNTYTNPDVIAALQKFTRLKVNMTDADNDKSQATAEKFGIVGVPSVLFIAPDGKEVTEARITGFTPPGEFIALMKSSPQLKAYVQKAKSKN